MKKFFTLLVVSATIFTSASAQYNHDGYNKGRDVTVNDGRYKKDDNRFNDHNYFEKEKAMKAAKINREYDLKIQAVRDNLFMGRRKKERLIGKLEGQRTNELQTLYVAYNDHGPRRNW